MNDKPYWKDLVPGTMLRDKRYLSMIMIIASSSREGWIVWLAAETIDIQSGRVTMIRLMEKNLRS